MTLFDAQYLTTYIYVLFVAVFVYKLVTRYISRLHYRLPPGPKGLPILGYMRALSCHNLWSHKDLYGEISHVTILGSDVVVLNSIDAIREAFLSSGGIFDFRTKSFYQKYIALKDIAVHSPSEPFWKKLRQMMHSSLKVYGRGIAEIESVITVELEHLTATLLKNETSIDLHYLLEPSICNIMYILLARIRFPYNHRMITMPLHFLDNMNDLLTPLIDQVLTLFPVLRFVPFGPGKLVKETITMRNEVVDFILDQYHQSTSNEQKGILFELLDQQKLNESIISQEHIKGAIEDIFEAGIHTTSTSLYHFFLIMLHYREIQKRIQAEIDDVVGCDRRPTLADKLNMPYTVAAVLELGRYGTLAPLAIPHACDRDAKLREYVIPKDTIILPNLFRINHDPDVWQDPWQFNPTRYLDNDGTLYPASHNKRKNTVVFGIGGRACLGEVFAKSRQFLYITYLLQKFTFLPVGEIPSCDPRDFKNGSVIRPERYLVKVEVRNDA